MDVGSSEDSSLISSGPAKSAHARGTSMLSVVSEAHTGSMTSINTCSQHVRKNSEGLGAIFVSEFKLCVYELCACVCVCVCVCVCMHINN